MDLQKQTLTFSDYRRDISVELVQHTPVKVLFEESTQDGLISAELFTPECTSGTLCPQLSHRVLHAGDRTFLSILVEQDETNGHLLFGLSILVSLVLISLLIFGYKKRMKQSRATPSNSQDDEAVSNSLTKETRQSFSSPLNGCSKLDSSTLEIQKHNGCHSNKHQPPDMKGTSQSFSKTTITRWWVWYVTLTVLLCLGLLVVTLGYKEKRDGSPATTLKVKIPKETHIRHIRSYSQDPDLKDIQMGKDGRSPFITRLQLLDLSPECRGNLSTCRVHALCDSTNRDGDVVCRCSRGYYLQDMTCLPCSTSCDDGFFMTQQCTAAQDVVCRPCTQCEDTSYEVATCTSTQDTLCIDVTFPIKQFLSKTSTEVLASLNATMSKNVFLEKLKKFRKLETSLYVSNNKQEMEFVWERGTGLEIKVKVSDIYLIPEYVEVEIQDDVEYVKHSNYPTDIIDQLSYVHDHHCKRPIPDEYDLIMSTSLDVANEAFEAVCEPDIVRCPKGVKPGDKYIRTRLLRRCRKVNNRGGQLFRTQTRNSVTCYGNSVLANQIFRKHLKEPENLRFPSQDCVGYKRDCDDCLQRRACYKGSNDSDCCNRACHLKPECKNLFSPTCPDLPVECVRGDISKFTIMPRYPSIHRQFSCHLKHKPPKYLYVLSYEASVPSLQFTFKERVREIMYKNLTDHQDGQEQVDYLLMNHKTESRYSNEVILFGVFNQSSRKDVSHYTLHRLKESWEFDHTTPFDIRDVDSSLKTSIQFERPFLYSTYTWVEDGCDKNVSQIISPQLIYHSFGLPLERPDITKKGEFIYQLYSKDSNPTIRFSMQENVSIMSYYKDMFKGSNLMAGTLKSNIRWDKPSQAWQLNITGFITECPGYFQVEILSESNTRLALYDMLVVCPRNFSLSFSIKHQDQQFSDIFTVVFNDTVTSYRMILTSMQSPQFLEKNAGNVVTKKMSHDFPWLPIVIILLVCFVISVLLLTLYVYCDKQKAKHIPIDINLPKPDLGAQITLLQGMDRPDKRDGFSLQTKLICSVLVILYIAYAILFTFSALFGMLHIIQGSSFTQITLLSNTSAKIQNQMQTRLKVMVNHENEESDKMLRAVENRLRACSNHYKSSLHESMPNLNHEVEKHITDIFGDIGTVREMLGRYFANKQESYQTEIRKFLTEFNHTVDRTLTNRLLVEYSHYLEEVADSRWLKFPRELFLDQQKRRGKFVTDVRENLMEFLTWLEIEKVQDVLEIKELLMKRLLTRMPVIDFTDFLDNSGAPNIVNSVNLTYGGTQKWLKFTTGLPPGYHSYNFNNRHSSNFPQMNNTPESGSDFIATIRAMLYPLFISTFLLLDTFLLIYRVSWLFKCVHKFKSGIEQRVPYDSITRTIHFFLTGIHVPRTEESLDHPYDYYMNNKDNIWGENTQLYFLYCQSTQKEKEEILKNIFATKQQTLNPEENKPKTMTWYSYCVQLLKFCYRIFIAPVFWRCILICGFVLFLCLITKVTEDLVTMESASFLMDTESMAPILSRQNIMTNTVLQQYGDYLNGFISKYKTVLDAETHSLNKMLEHVAERQSILLNTLISDMCNLAGLSECDNNISLVTTSLTSCNFLPIKPRLYTGHHDNILSEFIKSELSPVVTNFRSILLSVWYLLLGFAAAMLICQITARVVFVHLKKSRHLRTTKIYQLPSTFEWQDHQSFREKDLDVYASQSVIAESCESGVYDMTT